MCQQKYYLRVTCDLCDKKNKCYYCFYHCLGFKPSCCEVTIPTNMLRPGYSHKNREIWKKHKNIILFSQPWSWAFLQFVLDTSCGQNFFFLLCGVQELLCYWSESCLKWVWLGCTWVSGEVWNVLARTNFVLVLLLTLRFFVLGIVLTMSFFFSIKMYLSKCNKLYISSC